MRPSRTVIGPSGPSRDLLCRSASAIEQSAGGDLERQPTPSIVLIEYQDKLSNGASDPSVIPRYRFLTTQNMDVARPHVDTTLDFFRVSHISILGLAFHERVTRAFYTFALKFVGYRQLRHKATSSQGN